ncbi:MAG: tetratricopeptide repeat protein [Rhodospirillales bacterium]|nr:tetratricopeptide repeat protein [Rhodospirillales bacterium]
MLRWGFIIVLLGAAAAVAGWLAQRPGMVALEWAGYRIDTSVPVLLILIGALVVVCALLYRLWWSLRRVPRTVGRARQDRQQRRGYAALSRGLVAVAAGDSASARKQARRAETLVDDRPLVTLLSAQAAQLDGDEQAAARFFQSMSERPETAFLGVRGLLVQAMKREDWDQALTLARRAYRLNPKSEWVVRTLYDLQKRTGQWADAEATLGETSKLRLMPPDELPHERAELLYKQSLEFSDERALDWARRAHKADPGFVPAAIRYASLLCAAGKNRRAAAMIERTWERTPDPGLAEAYWSARQADDGLKKVQTAQRLAKHNPGHIESRIAVAVAALEARLWGEARTNLESIAGPDAPPRVCLLMAELEEAEHGDLARARTWLMRAATDEHAPGMSSQVPQMMPRPAD